MIIFNQDRTMQLHENEVDYTKGYIRPTNEFQDDDMWNEEKRIFIYIPYTEQQLSEQEISRLKQLLCDTDYQAIKYAEGEISQEEYAVVKEQRKQWRAKINELEEELTEV